MNTRALGISLVAFAFTAAAWTTLQEYVIPGEQDIRITAGIAILIGGLTFVMAALSDKGKTPWSADHLISAGVVGGVILCGWAVATRQWQSTEGIVTWFLLLCAPAYLIFSGLAQRRGS